MSRSHNGTLNTYECPCGNTWEDEWCCGCDDECSECGRDIQPSESEVLHTCTECTEVESCDG